MTLHRIRIRSVDSGFGTYTMIWSLRGRPVERPKWHGNGRWRLNGWKQERERRVMKRCRSASHAHDERYISSPDYAFFQICGRHPHHTTPHGHSQALTTYHRIKLMVCYSLAHRYDSCIAPAHSHFPHRLDRRRCSCRQACYGDGPDWFRTMCWHEGR